MLTGQKQQWSWQHGGLLWKMVMIVVTIYDERDLDSVLLCNGNDI